MPNASLRSGQCYCGKSRLVFDAPPRHVAYCHCQDCRRVTGAPVAAFAAFEQGQVVPTPAFGASVQINPGVERWFCDGCGSPLACRFDYLPGQMYIPVGILDFTHDLKPELHCHVGEAIAWMSISDDIPRIAGSGRAGLLGTGHEA